MKCWLLLALLLAGCNLATAPVTTEATTFPQADLICNQVATSALQAIGPNCDAIGVNQACYGHELVEAQFRQGIQATFGAIGDVAQLQSLRLISTAPFNEEQQTWGVALMRAQVGLPGTLPGESVTFLLYGGATLDNVTPDMEAVILSTGFGNTTTCAAIPPPAMLLQSPNGAQVTMSINGANVSIGSTLYLTAVRNDSLTIATVNGNAVVAALGISQNVGPGAQVTLPLGATGGLEVIGPPSAPQPFDQSAIQRAPLNLLPNSVQIPPPIAGSEPLNTTQTTPSLPITATLPPVTIPLPPTAIPTACSPRADWAFTYTIVAGDTLLGIAQRFGLTLADLQNGNCIADANIISVGQTLRVPTQLAPTAVSTTTPLPTTESRPPAASATATTPIFRADNTLLRAGECTTISWSVENIDSVFFEGEPAIGNDRRQVCPPESTRYTLLVIYRDGSQSPFFLSIEVEQPANEENNTN